MRTDYQLTRPVVWFEEQYTTMILKFCIHLTLFKLWPLDSIVLQFPYKFCHCLAFLKATFIQNLSHCHFFHPPPPVRFLTTYWLWVKPKQWSIKPNKFYKLDPILKPKSGRVSIGHQKCVLRSSSFWNGIESSRTRLRYGDVTLKVIAQINKYNLYSLYWSQANRISAIPRL